MNEVHCGGTQTKLGDQTKAGAWERFRTDLSSELSESKSTNSTRRGLGSQVVTMMQTTESWERHYLGATIWLRAWVGHGRVFFQSEMSSVEVVIADIF